MSSGRRSIVINPQERLVSADINRLQSFAAQEQAELLRYMLNVTAEDDLGAAAVITEYSSAGSPLRAEIMNGLLVRPTAASFDLTVDPGVMMALQPDAGVDDSNYKFVRDPGSASGLTITANASGSVRIDVIECQIDANPAIVTATRDIFNTVTGTFSASLLTKEVRGQLTYRVRAGTPGSGYPGASSGWLPLAIVRVPSGAGSNDDCTFWDVRPLISDRQFQPFALSANAQVIDVDGNLIRNGATDARLSGLIHAVYGGRRAGGIIRRGTPGTDADYLVMSDTANGENNGASVAEPLASPGVFLYLMFPFGLPRWARYTDGPVGRVPRAPRGIPVVSAVAPAHGTHVPGSAITLPTSTGLGGTSSEGVCVLQVPPNSVSQYCKGSWANRIGMFAGISQFINGTYNGGTGISTFSMTDALWPKNAKAIYVRMSLTVTVGATSSVNFPSVLNVFSDNAAAQYAGLELPHVALSNHTGGAAGRTYSSGVVRVPLAQLYPGGSPATPRKIEWSLATGLTVTANSLSILGYEL